MVEDAPRPDRIRWNQSNGETVSRDFPLEVLKCHSAVISPTETGATSHLLLDAFCFAGVEIFVGTLWKPDSDRAAFFGESFFTHLLDGVTAGEALRLAKVDSFESNRGQDVSWASYVLFGNANYVLPEGLPAANPYPFLDSYTEENKSFFFGRDNDTDRFVRDFHSPHHHITVLTGDSGVGKSSFLRAAVVPTLRKQGWDCAVVNMADENPIPMIVQAITDQILKAPRPVSRSSAALLSLEEFFSSSEELRNRSLCVCLDQFERYVPNTTKPYRDRFEALMRELLRAREVSGVEVKYVFSLRREFMILLFATPELRDRTLRWTPSFGPKSGVAKVEPAGSVLLVVLSCNRGWRPVPATRNCLTLAVEPTGTPASALMRR